MLDRLLTGMKVVALAAGAFACVAFGMTLLSIRTDVRQTAAQLNTAAAQASAAIQQVSVAIIRDAERLTTRADRLMIVAGATTTQAHLAAKSQRLFWEQETPRLVARANALLDQSNTFLANGSQLLVTADGTMADLQAGVKTTASQVELTGAAMQQALQIIPAMAHDPELRTIKANLARLSGSSAQIGEDVAYKFHRYVRPDQLKGKDKVWYYAKGTSGFLKDLAMLLYFWP